MSAETKYLNVDDVVPDVAKVLTIKGVSYEFSPPSIGDFLTEMKKIQSLQAKQASEEGLDQVEAMVTNVESMKASIKGSFPTITEEALNGLTHMQMRAIREFIANQFDREDVSPEDESGNG